MSKIPNNYYGHVNVKKLQLDKIDELENLPKLPEATPEDVGKIVRVGENGYILGEDAGTVLPTPGAEDIGKVVKVDSNKDYALATDEGLPAVTSADNGKVLAVVNGSWAPELRIEDIETIKGLKITMSNGGHNSTCLPPLTFKNPITGEIAALVANTDYTMTCPASLVTGNMSLTGAPDIANADTPVTFDIDFINEVNIKKYSYINLSNAVAFTYSLAKNIKIEISPDAVTYITVYDESTLDWSTGPKTFDIYGGPVNPLPIPTAADAGKVLTVDNAGAWELDNVPSELPAVTSSDAGKVLGVDNNGDWVVKNDIQTTIIHGTADSAPAVSTITFDKAINLIVEDLLANITHDCIVVARVVTSIGMAQDCVFHIDSYQEASSGFVTAPDTFTFHRLVKNFLDSNKIQLEEFTLSGNDTTTSVTVDRYDLT